MQELEEYARCFLDQFEPPDRRLDAEDRKPDRETVPEDFFIKYMADSRYYAPPVFNLTPAAATAAISGTALNQQDVVRTTVTTAPEARYGIWRDTVPWEYWKPSVSAVDSVSDLLQQIEELKARVDVLTAERGEHT